MKINLLVATVVCVLYCSGCRQDSGETAQSPMETDSATVETPILVPELEKQLIEQGLVDVREVDSTILVELKYSTNDNFFGEDVYGDLTNAYLQPDVAQKLKQAQQELTEQFPNRRLLVYDGVRPHSVQKILWEKLDSIPVRSREAFVANPSKGSIHNFGCAVDLTIFDADNDSTLDMGTTYDFFGYLAYPRKESENLRRGLLTRQQIANRQLLRDVMAKAGFQPITSEWWHFNATSLRRAKVTYQIVK